MIKIAKIKEIKFSRQTMLLIAAAFIFSAVCRLYWVGWASEFDPFYWNGQLMISTNDGYAFAEGARDMVAGFHQPNDLSYYGRSMPTLTYWLTLILPFKFETILLYMSVFFGSLIVVPVILISREYGVVRAGFVAALLAGVANSYYNRTMAGYYDTDMLTIVLPMMSAWSIIRLAERKTRINLIFIPIFILLNDWWYPSSYSLNFAIIGMFFIYILVFERRNAVLYEALIFMLIALTHTFFWLKIALILAVYAFIYFRPDLFNKRAIALLATLVVVFFTFCGGLDPIWFQLKFYLFRGIADNPEISFQYYNVNQTIRESSTIDFMTFAQRISGHVVTFLASLIGIVMLCFRFRSFLLTLPILFLGFLALKGGLRFTIYAVPIAAIGFGFFARFIAADVLKLNRWDAKIVLIGISFLALLPCLQHIKNYKVPTVFYQSEVESIDALKYIASREDYALAWWDYGYPLRYYADVKTLIDGGKHLGKDNFAVSFALGEDQTRSANMARLEVEYTERRFSEKFDSNLAQMMKDYNVSNVNDFLFSLNGKGFKTPEKTREIYYYLPDRMMDIFSTVLQFSRLDLIDGKPTRNALFFSSDRLYQNENGIDITGGFVLPSDMSYILYFGEKIPINTYFEVGYDENSKLTAKAYKRSENSRYYVIFMKDYERFLILDESTLNSTYIQLFVFENYDKELFEPIILNGAVKIYRLLK